MTDDMIERVARAICVAHDIEPDAETMMTRESPIGKTELYECPECENPASVN